MGENIKYITKFTQPDPQKQPNQKYRVVVKFQIWKHIPASLFLLFIEDGLLVTTLCGVMMAKMQPPCV